jgi:imidazolonepropionase-like amidohydrolase
MGPHRLAWHRAWLTGLLLACGVASAAPEVLAIEGITVVDVDHGVHLGPRSVLIVERRIAALDAPGSVAIPDGATRVDGRGLFLVPGFTDAHVHLFNNASRRPPNDWAFPLFVAHGVTRVRDMMTRPDAMPTVRAWRQALADRSLIAPRVITSTPVSGEDEAALRAQVRAAHEAGVDAVKVFSGVSGAAYNIIRDAAREVGMPVYGHVPAGVGVWGARQHSNEHLMQVYEACSPLGRSALVARSGLSGEALIAKRDAQEAEVLAAYRNRPCQIAAALLARQRAHQVPTLVLAHFEARGDATGFRADPRYLQLRPDERARWERILATRSAAEVALGVARREVSLKIVRELHQAGVPLVAGTDAPMPLVYPGSSLHEEMGLLVEAGLSPAAALRTATLGAAEMLDQETGSGRIAVGMPADLVLLEADPLADIAHTRRIRSVMLDGRLLDRAALDALLAPAPGVQP